MAARRISRILPAVLLLAAALGLVSCATSRGTTLQRVTSTQQRSSGGGATPPQEPTQNPPGTTSGLQVLTDPSNVEVYIDGDYKGLSPVVMEEISVGWHRVVLKKQGYYDSSGWVQFTGDPLLYQVSLTQIIGFLRVTATPTNVEVLVDGTSTSGGTQQVGVGEHEVTVRSFGYTPYTATVTIAEKQLTALDVNLQPAPFAITAFSLPKSSVNPHNPGTLGSIDVDFSVTGPGTGRLFVLDGTGTEVYSRSLPPFTTWDQAFTWDVHTEAGAALPDGQYTVSVSASGDGAETATTRQATLTVDSTLRVLPRSLWSGSSGLLYAPVTEVLPPGDFQLGLLGAGIATTDLSSIQAPLQVGVRLGAVPGIEVDASAGLIGTSTVLPLFGTVAARWEFLPPRDAVGTSAALQAKLSVQVSTSQSSTGPLMTDTFANFSGLSVEVPLELTLGAISGLLSFGVNGSFWYPYLFRADGVTPAFGPVTWLYLRAGILLDLGSVTAGISASTRTGQLPGGVAFLAWPTPFQAGAEVHWLVPGTGIVVSAIVAGEYEDSANYYFMGGAGLGIIY
ncbi:MAG TPA: PEGA domain-containing protein [Spirochaetia bacterium]|nr:PEGA domain-containing protein [Spirochaetia bacterium]